MAASGKKNMFNEATRVQMPAMVHLTRLGYTYFGKITEDMAGIVYDPDTNILINVFKEQFARLNPTHAGEAEQTLKTIRQELDNDDIGRSFYERLSSVSPVRLVDFENPKNNTYHFTAEFTCKRDQDEFRPDTEYLHIELLLRKTLLHFRSLAWTLLLSILRRANTL